jgi:LysM repeat protein
MLKEEFIAAVAAANPRLDTKNLKPGTLLQVPDPAAYRTDGRGPQAPKSSRPTVRYEVQQGDTLETIARNHLGAKKHWRVILDCNPGLNPRRLMPGQEIFLPAK